MKRVCVWGTALKKVADEADAIAFVHVLAKRFPGTRVTTRCLHPRVPPWVRRLHGYSEARVQRATAAAAGFRSLAWDDAEILAPCLEATSEVQREWPARARGWAPRGSDSCDAS